eukprot:TRINITY_DN3732_c0_g2_i9.p1 TRINITY_DN3732_c0_g2~~TRINITY_DN3732_c0_g2_i9.p1  ORF type:complete len:374 (-),score=87.81 TRINITY_DN3732_c0_g2_i9:367-1488(-)
MDWVTSTLGSWGVVEYDVIEGVKYMKRGEYNPFLETLGVLLRPTVSELRAREEALDTNITERRKRYTCRGFTVPSEIVEWETYVSKIIPTHRQQALERAQHEVEQRKIIKIEKEKANQKYEELVQKKLAKKEEDRATGLEVSDEEHEKERKRLETLSPEELAKVVENKELFKKRREELKARRKKEQMKEQQAIMDDTVLFPYEKPLNHKIRLWHGNIVAVEVDAIVNAANESLLGGGGVDGIIHAAAGPWLKEECHELDGCATGNTKITRGYCLPARHVLHTVGPVGRNKKALASCYETCLNLAVENNLKTICFCGISTGIFGYPLYSASRVALETTRKWLERDSNHEKVIFAGAGGSASAGAGPGPHHPAPE